MIEKEFRDLVTSLELNNTEKRDINSFLSLITSTIKDDTSKTVKINDCLMFPSLDNINNYENTFNLFIYITFKNKNLPIELARIVSINEVVNSLFLNIKNNIIYKDQMPIITTDYENSKVFIKFSDYSVNFYFCFKKDNIIKSLVNTDSLTCFSDNLYCYKEYFEKSNKNYNRFYKTLSVITYFRHELKQEYGFLEYLIDSILLNYGLENYESESNIIDYLKVYTHAINDLIEGKEIILSDDLYKTLGVIGSFTPKDNYKIIDISNKQNNLIASFSSLKTFKDLKSLIVSKFPKDGKSVVIDVTPSFVMKDSTIGWEFKIIDTEISNHGGEYPYDYDNYLSTIYKAMLKGLQFVVKNKLGNNITFNIKKDPNFSLKDAFPNQSIKEDMNKLSYENQSRYANVLNYAKDFDLGLEYKIY